MTNREKLGVVQLFETNGDEGAAKAEGLTLIEETSHHWKIFVVAFALSSVMIRLFFRQKFLASADCLDVGARWRNASIVYVGLQLDMIS